jgi:hypothetical protein
LHLFDILRRHKITLHIQQGVHSTHEAISVERSTIAQPPEMGREMTGTNLSAISN